MRRLLLGTALVLASLSMLACTSDEDTDGNGDAATVAATTETTATVATTAGTATTEPATTTPAGGTAAAGGEEVQTEIARFTFETPLEVAVGTSVTWTNTEEPHTVTARDGSFDSGRIPQDESFTHTFDTAGTFDYFCQVHPAMEGTVVVE